MSTRKSDRSWVFFWIVSVILVAAAIAQTFMIFWGSGRSERQRQSAETSRDGYSLITSNRIYLSIQGSEGFVLVPGETGDHRELAGLAVDLMRAALPDAVIQAYADGDARINAFLKRSACVLELEATRTSAEVRAEFALPDNRVPEGTFDQVWVLPALSVMEDVTVLFLDSETGHVLEAIGGSYLLEENRELLNAVLRIAAAVDEDHVWQTEAFDGAFTKAGFVRLSGSEQGARGRIRSAFMADGEVQSARMRRYGMSFFEFPDTVSERHSGEEPENADLILSNEKITVRLFPEGRLLYVETLTEEEKEPVGLSEAYNIAAGFLDRDMSASGGEKQRWILRRFEASAEDYVFYFDYTLEGSVLSMWDVLGEWDMEAPVIVTVRGSKVRRYERFVAHIELEEAAGLRYSWMEVADQCSAEGMELIAPPRLVYETSHGQVFLYWKIETTEGEVYRFAI